MANTDKLSLPKWIWGSVIAVSITCISALGGYAFRVERSIAEKDKRIALLEQGAKASERTHDTLTNTLDLLRADLKDINTSLQLLKGAIQGMSSP